jgi:apolipoprotein N-acyltransferase
MQDAASSAPRINQALRFSPASRLRSALLPLTDWAIALVSSALLVLAFPNFNFWPLAAVGLVPLLLVIAARPNPWRAFLLGWLTGTVFFYGSCHWLTFSMVHYGGIPQPLAYLLLLPIPMLVGIFPAVFALLLARSIGRWGVATILAAPILWVALEWARLGVTGQLWNALGYSQAYHPLLIQSARWGGVYAVGFLLVALNAAIAFLILKRNIRAAAVAGVVLIAIGLIFFGHKTVEVKPAINSSPGAIVVALQPNVPMDLVKSTAEMQSLLDRHVTMTEEAIKTLPDDGTPRLVVWPESPMNFAYGSDAQLRELLVNFATRNKTAVLFNSQEPAPNDGIYNSAVFVNEQGRLIAQYDKIRLLPFGEYVPLPRWMPGANLITAIVGDFTAGDKFTLMPVGQTRAGVFICVESAYPFIARSLANEGADVLINISNDGYLGPTAVMQQHLANAIFRAVENDRPIMRVTNTGITAYITPRGEVEDATGGFQTAVRTWRITRNSRPRSFYSRYGDVFAGFCAVISVLMFVTSFRLKQKRV